MDRQNPVISRVEEIDAQESTITKFGAAVYHMRMGYRAFFQCVYDILQCMGIGTHQRWIRGQRDLLGQDYM
jgi:hypothetical protein